MGLFLDSQETLLVIKYPFRKAGTNISKQPTARGRAKKKPQKKSCVSKKSIRIRAEKNNIKGILICESTKRNYLSVAKSYMSVYKSRPPPAPSTPWWSW